MWKKWVDSLMASGLIAENDQILAAVSGGPDSVFLLRLLLALRKKKAIPFKLEVAHVNHQLRGHASKADALFVEQLARECGVPFHLRNVDVQALRQAAWRGLEDAARQLRYEALLTVCRERGLNKIAVGHHADDQVETVLHRFLRGAGLQGLRGMEKTVDYQGITLIRPLLGIWKDEILAICHDRGWDYRQDESNWSTEYTRNKIRLELIPLLETYNPRIKNRLLTFSERIRDEDDYLHQAARQLVSKSVRRHDREWEIDIPTFSAGHPALQRRAIRILLKCLLPDGVTGRHIEAVMHAISAGGPAVEIDLPKGIKARRVYHKLIIQPLEKESARGQPYLCRLEIPGRQMLHQAGYVVETALESAVEMPAGLKPRNRLEAYFDWEALKQNGPLVVRARKPGDRVALLGLNGAKKVKDIFIDAKVPRLMRASYPIVAQGEHVLWVPGLARSRHALVTQASRKILVIRLYKSDDQT